MKKFLKILNEGSDIKELVNIQQKIQIELMNVAEEAAKKRLKKSKMGDEWETGYKTALSDIKLAIQESKLINFLK